MFGEAAVRLWGAASTLLGWRPDEFWDSTPTEFAGALNLANDVVDVPDLETIEALRRRFPDVSHARPANMNAAAPTMQTNAPR